MHTVGAFVLLFTASIYFLVRPSTLASVATNNGLGHNPPARSLNIVILVTTVLLFLLVTAVSILQAHVDMCENECLTELDKSYFICCLVHCWQNGFYEYSNPRSGSAGCALCFSGVGSWYSYGKRIICHIWLAISNLNFVFFLPPHICHFTI